jgi:hypothetical protein
VNAARSDNILAPEHYIDAWPKLVFSLAELPAFGWAEVEMPAAIASACLYSQGAKEKGKL